MHDRIGNIVTYTASGTAIIGGLALNDWAAIIGSVVAVAAFVHNVLHKRELRRIARAQCAAATVDEVDA